MMQSEKTQETEPSLFAIATLAGGADRIFYYANKRILDVSVAALVLIVLSPLLILIAVLIKLDSPGPVIYVQQRVGSTRRRKRWGSTWEIQSFPFYKFRSMFRNVDQSLHQKYMKKFYQGEGARNDVGKLREVTAIEGECGDLAFFNDLTHARIVCLYQRCSRGHVDDL